MRTQMSSNLNKIYLGIIGKPNSGKSTLFNALIGDQISPVGNEYGLTKQIYKQKFSYNNYEFIIIDTPGLRRRSKVTAKDEVKRNSEVIKLLNKVEIIILLIDSLESITKQDFRLADLSISKNKIVFFLFNKIDIIDDKKKFRNQLKNFLEKNYNKYKLININFISAKKNQKVSKVLDQIIDKKKLIKVKIKKKNLNNFLDNLNRNASFPKVNNIEIKPKYIVQIEDTMPKFKVFINTKKKCPQLFQKYFDNSFRKYFSLEGIPIRYDFINSKNPYAN